MVRQLTYVGPGRVAWEDAPDPALGDPGGALLRPLAVARCDLDRAMALTGMFPGPFPLGHEFVAEIVEVGDDVGDRHAGERVVVPFQVSCGTCHPCREERFAACQRYRARMGAAFGFGEAGGGHGGAVADFVAVPAADHLLVPAPSRVPPATLCTVPDNLVDAYRAVAPPLSERPGAAVLVVGANGMSIGLYAVAIAVALGAHPVHYVDSDPTRCATATKLGAEATLHAGPWPRRFDRAPITVDNTGDADGLACTLRSTDEYGYCTSVGVQFTPTTPIPLLDMYTKGVTLHASRADSRRYVHQALHMVTSGLIDPLSVPTTIVGWDEADRAWLEPATKLIVER